MFPRPDDEDSIVKPSEAIKGWEQRAREQRENNPATEARREAAEVAESFNTPEPQTLGDRIASSRSMLRLSQKEREARALDATFKEKERADAFQRNLAELEEANAGTPVLSAKERIRRMEEEMHAKKNVAVEDFATGNVWDRPDADPEAEAAAKKEFRTWDLKKSENPEEEVEAPPAPATDLPPPVKSRGCCACVWPRRRKREAQAEALLAAETSAAEATEATEAKALPGRLKFGEKDAGDQLGLNRPTNKFARGQGIDGDSDLNRPTNQFGGQGIDGDSDLNQSMRADGPDGTGTEGHGTGDWRRNLKKGGRSGKSGENGSDEAEDSSIAGERSSPASPETAEVASILAAIAAVPAESPRVAEPDSPAHSPLARAKTRGCVFSWSTKKGNRHCHFRQPGELRAVVSK